MRWPARTMLPCWQSTTSLRGDPGGVVGVVGGPVGQGQDFPGARVLDDDGAARSLRVLDGGGQLPLGDVLDAFIEGEDDASAFAFHLIAALEPAAAAVGGDDQAAGAAAEGDRKSGVEGKSVALGG